MIYNSYVNSYELYLNSLLSCYKTGCFKQNQYKQDYHILAKRKINNKITHFKTVFPYNEFVTLTLVVT